MLYDARILEIPWFLKAAMDEVGQGAEARVAHQGLATHVTIVDESCALVDCDPHRPLLLYTTAPLLVKAFDHLFDLCWERAVTLVAESAGSPVGVLDETARAVLRLVVQGEKNDGIARRLGISPRTVSRSIQSLHAAYGVTTRAALIAVAVQPAQQRIPERPRRSRSVLATGKMPSGRRRPVTRER
jgi:DNA-binding CsgD family transcriptional regulator